MAGLEYGGAGSRGEECGVSLEARKDKETDSPEKTQQEPAQLAHSLWPGKGAFGCLTYRSLKQGKLRPGTAAPAHL